ncbi:acetylornithine deacetylase/succinyl-diaminopimelate desuccinylase-like protein [Erwinia toletana]|uniref:Acetylornithine deacetylase/succinyl-diaminopimelate desuccinylase-like protein n=1 Tax=Winslowiella toletana TaxID=92490 RepID=A0ABS4PFT0_9GAMM|nr:M20 family metallopeptidase [Winslowiella toletana]MBP2171503.1 acetylornithine deacetylase/succinyl-diaminopimelate desuccinylase-like protein [Winslowiella toletana]
MTGEQAVALATAYFDSGEFKRVLARRVALATESQRDDRDQLLQRYLDEEIAPALSALGFTLHQFDNPQAQNRPFMIATRIEDPQLPTMLCYGHGDVVFGDDENWRAGLTPWQLVEEGDRWYARGSADNKGQHSVNIAALEQVYQARGGKLGFNCTFLFEMGEEISSPGLAEICRQQPDLLRADLFIASDGPRLNAVRPTLFLGSRGCVNFRLSINARARDYHSGNWGGLLSNPGTQLANAIACLVNQQGQLQVAALKPPAISAQVRAILSDIAVGGNENDPDIDNQWGEAGLSGAERLYGWNTLEVLSFLTGNPARPMNAIPGKATAVCQLRFVVETDWENLAGHISAHLRQHGFDYVEVDVIRGTPATRLNPTDPLVSWALEVMESTSGKKPALLPNLGGSLPNDVFSDILGLPTLWIPHSYPACGQHAVDEHMLKSIAREGLQMMTALLWDLGEQGAQLIARHQAHQAQSGEKS